jgi:hypothetical protein
MSINRWQKKLFSVQDAVFIRTPLRNPGPIRSNMAEVSALISGRAKEKLYNEASNWKNSELQEISVEISVDSVRIRRFGYLRES